MRVAAILLGMMVATPPLVAQTHPERPIFRVPGQALFIALDTVGGVAATAPGSPDSVFRTLYRVYESLDVPLTFADSSRGMIGTTRLVRSRRLGMVPLSRIFDCGSHISGPFADHARVYIGMMTFVRPAPGGRATVRTAVVGAAESLDGTQRERVMCVSTGFLESELFSRLRTRLAQP